MSNTCLNCDTLLTGNFCAKCGQPKKGHRGPIWQVVGQFSEEFFTPNSKFFKNLYSLFFKPGYLSKQFIDGQRMSVLPPVRMYLVVSLIFFLVFDIPHMDVKDSNVYIGGILLGHEKPIEGKPRFNFFGSTDKSDPINIWFDKVFADKKKQMQEGNPQVTVDRIFNQLEDLLPNALILFLPLFALLMKVLYLFKRILYFDHLIFALHFQTWLMGMILIIYALALQNPYWSWLTVLIPIYLARAQKLVYKQTYWLVIPKTFAIIVIYIVLLAFAGLAAMIGSVALI